MNRPSSSMINEWVLRLLDEYSDISAAPQIALYGAHIGCVVENHENLPRAMDYARTAITQCVKSGRSYVNGTVILADQLSQSKGRFARKWYAPRGGIWGCLAIANDMLPQTSRFIPFAVGLACCETLRQLGCDTAYLRWVNDVLVTKMKVAGFLIEMFTEPLSRQEYILAGFGINVNNENFPSEFSANAQCLRTILGQPLEIAEISAQFLARLRWYFGVLQYEEKNHIHGKAFSGAKGQHLLLEKWLAYSDSIDKKVWYGFDVMNSPQYMARVKAVNADGGLVMQLDDGAEKTEYSGEIRYISPNPNFS